MKQDGAALNYKINNIALVNRYKVRQLKSFNINLKPIQCQENRDFKIDNNYSPFTINSRQLPQYKK